MQLYRGVNTSLYSSLDLSSVDHLERAITLTEQGAYGEAQVVFDEKLNFQHRLNAVVVLEKAELALKQFKLGVLYRILDEALATASKTDLDVAEYRLMATLRAFAALSHKGNVCDTYRVKYWQYKRSNDDFGIQINPATAELERARNWLKDVSVSEYTDVQVIITWIHKRTN